ncbi:MAG: hypothetical protein MR902_05495 [Campylobacter sp.]|nr:hypothetical protein [Campylobacter sp.]
MKKIFIVVFAILFAGCVQKTPQSSTGLKFTIISPMVKISDMGFLHRYKNEINLQIYSSGVSVLNLYLKEKVCMNGACDDEMVFNSKFFKREHYRGFLGEILSAKPIYDGRNLQKSDCGFTQIISDDIKYSVCNDEVSFKDAKFNIKINYKEIN